MKHLHSAVRSMLILFALTVAITAPASLLADEFKLDTFERKQLTDVYFSEGAAAGDLNRDGHVDAVYGPYWFEGPDFKTKHEIYAPKPQPTERYADHFFAWVYDFNGDEWPDVFTVGFPGTPAYVYENPGKGAAGRHWTRHEVFDWVSNESPQLVNLVGDERPELVCTSRGHFGYAAINWEKPFEKWTFHPLSKKIAVMRFGHGLGVGDVNGDGRNDVIHSKGWFEQPAKPTEDGLWTHHVTSFTNAYGGAEMYAYDVDGDGDNDVITSLAAHDFGLAWYEQVREGDRVTFRQHLIMGDRPEQSRFGLVFTELHSVNLADIDGDGLKDIVTGKTYWSHHKQSPMWDAGAVVYWFRLTRTKDGVVWVPHKADGEAGIGRQVRVVDVNGDKLPDIVTGGMKGGHVLIHRRNTVSEKEWLDAQPKVYENAATESLKRGKPSAINAKTGKVDDAVEGEALKVVKVTGGGTATQKMGNFSKDKWSGDEQLFWRGAKPGDTLELELPVAKASEYTIRAAFTMAKDYGIVQVHLDGKAIGKPLDLYNYPDVITTGVLDLGKHRLNAGKHKLTFEIKGKNAAAVAAYMLGLDYVLLGE